jgi:hypothetical protein
VVVIYESFTLRYIGNYAFRVFVFLIIIPTLSYSLAGAFTKIKRNKYIAVFVTMLLSIFIYYEVTKPPVPVRMKEDVLYILPKSKIPKSEIPKNTYNADSIYNGTKNDPNLKRDTIK